MHNGTILPPIGYQLRSGKKNVNAGYFITVGFLATGTPWYSILFCNLRLGVALHHRTLS